MFTETGDEQGAVNDIYFDERSGRVTAMEISGGRVSDLTNGTRHLPVDEIVRVGPDVLYVRPETAQQLEAQQGGLTGAVSDAGDRAKGAASKASAKASGHGAIRRAYAAAGSLAGGSTHRRSEAVATSRTTRARSSSRTVSGSPRRMLTARKRRASYRSSRRPSASRRSERPARRPATRSAMSATRRPSCGTSSRQSSAR